MSKTVRKLFGGTDKETQRKIAQQTEDARGTAGQLFASSERNRNAGFQNVLDLQSLAIPEQIKNFQDGNVNAQRTLLQGLPDFQNALLGNSLQGNISPVRQESDTSFLDFAQLPDTETIGESFLKRDPSTEALLAGINTDADLFREAAAGRIGTFGKGDKNFFRDMAANILASDNPGQSRFVNDPLDSINTFMTEKEAGKNVEGGLEEKSITRLSQLLNTFAGL